MNRAVGDYVFISPISYDSSTEQWTGKVVDRGAKVITYTTIYECDKVKYYDKDIYTNATYEGDTVHVVSYENTIKIEGVY